MELLDSDARRVKEREREDGLSRSLYRRSLDLSGIG